MIVNHFNNQYKKERGNRHNEEAKKFALTFYFYICSKLWAMIFVPQISVWFLTQ